MAWSLERERRVGDLGLRWQVEGWRSVFALVIVVEGRVARVAVNKVIVETFNFQELIVVVIEAFFGEERGGVVGRVGPV